MPADCRPDITLRKVWGNIEKYRIINAVKYEQLAKAMHMTVQNLYLKRKSPATLKVADIIYAAKYLGVEVEELFK